MAEVDRRGHPYHSVFNDLNFRKSANNVSITQNQTESQGVNSKDEKIKALRNEVKKISNKNKNKMRLLLIKLCKANA